MFSALIADQPPADSPPQQQAQRGGPDIIFLILPLFLLFWLVVLRPMSQRQKKDQEAMLAGLKSGNKVVLSSGVVGVIVSAKEGEDEVIVRSDDAKFRVKRYAVAQVVGADDAVKATK